MPSPLKWNAERTWTFGVQFRQPVLYLLRDHINMFTDLAKDWSTGPPVDFFKFIPMHYILQVDLQQYELSLYANDHNIIDKPLIRDENGECIIVVYSIEEIEQTNSDFDTEGTAAISRSKYTIYHLSP